MQYISDPYKLGIGGLKCPTILTKTFLIGLIALNPKENPLAQAIVLYNNPVNYLYIVYYFINTNFV